jgi:putative chitinase
LHRLEALTHKQADATHPTPAATLHTASPRLNDSSHPDHALYQQALDGVHKIDSGMGRTSDQHSANLAAALTVAAKTQGLTRIDAVALSEDGSRTFAAQNSSPLRKLADVATTQAVSTPIEQSSIAAHVVQPEPTCILVPHMPPLNQQQAPQQTGPNP